MGSELIQWSETAASSLTLWKYSHCFGIFGENNISCNVASGQYNRSESQRGLMWLVITLTYSNLVSVDYKTFYCQAKVLIFIICLMFTVLLGYGHKTAGEVASHCEHCAQSDQSRPDFHTWSACFPPGVVLGWKTFPVVGSNVLIYILHFYNLNM